MVICRSYLWLCTKGDNALLAFHYNQKSGSYYDLQIGQNGAYSFHSYKNNHYPLLAWGQSYIAYHSGHGQPNRIALVVQENTFELYINDQYITTVSNPNNVSNRGSISFGSGSDEKTSSEGLFGRIKICRDH